MATRGPGLVRVALAVPVLLLAAGPALRLVRKLAAVASLLMSPGSRRRVDTHFHALPAAFVAAVAEAGGDPSGFPTPDWSIDAALQSMDTVGSSIGILSVTSPGVSIAGTGAKARELARTLNDELGRYATDHAAAQGRVGFFGALPDWQDVDGTVAEIEYLYDTQQLCSGVTVFTSYGGRLLGDALFAPIWAVLQARRALVFVHPAVLDVQPVRINPSLPQPIVDYPLATTRTAVDLVMSGTLRACPDVDVILSHAGGALPFVGARALSSLMLPAIQQHVNVTYLQAKADFARFYYDLALSTTPAQLHALLDFASPDRVLFGTDFPYVPQFAIASNVLAYTSFVATDPRGPELHPDVLSRNALALLKKHAQKIVFE